VNTIVRVVVDLAEVPEEVTEVNKRGSYVLAITLPAVISSATIPYSSAAT